MEKLIEITSKAIQTDTSVIRIEDLCNNIILEKLFRNTAREKIVIFLVNQDGYAYGFEELSTGNEMQSSVTVREMFRSAIRYDAEGIIIIHNHVKGDLMFSEEDIEFTNKIIKSCKILGITFIDHLLVQSVTGKCISLTRQSEVSNAITSKED